MLHECSRMAPQTLLIDDIMRAEAKTLALYISKCWPSDCQLHASCREVKLCNWLKGSGVLLIGILLAVRGDLVVTLKDLLTRKERFDYILIETTGLADPAPVAQTFFMVCLAGTAEARICSLKSKLIMNF